MRRLLSPHALLIVVATGYGCAALSQVPSLVAFNWDEVVYASQVRPGVPAVPMSAPRAWGMPLLLAPVAALTQSVPVIRCYLAVLAGVCLYLAFRPWLGLFGPAARPARPRDALEEAPGAVSRYAVPLAAALFVTLWSTVLYGAMAYPNLWLAFALVAAAGWFCRALREPGRTGAARRPRGRARRGLAAAAHRRGRGRAAAARRRRGPGGTAGAARPRPARRGRGRARGGLGRVAGRGVRAVRRPALPAAPGRGGERGAARLRAARGTWRRWTGRPCCAARRAPARTSTGSRWPGGSRCRCSSPRRSCSPRRPGRCSPLTLACAVTFALPYLTLFDYANPRFLQPAYALLAVCAGAALVRLPLSRLTRLPAIAGAPRRARRARRTGRSATARPGGRPGWSRSSPRSGRRRTRCSRRACGRPARSSGGARSSSATSPAAARCAPPTTRGRATRGCAGRSPPASRSCWSPGTRGRAPEGWTRLRLPGRRAYARQGANGSSN